MANTSNGYQHMPTLAKEYMKHYITFDIHSRMEFVYEARANALHDEPCLKTQYAYADSSSTTAYKMKESEATWDESWDIA